MGRTSKNIKLRIPEKPHKIKGFRSGSYRVATTISRCLVNHSDKIRRKFLSNSSSQIHSHTLLPIHLIVSLRMR